MKQNSISLRILGWVFFFLSGALLGLVFFLGRDTVLTVSLLISRSAYLPRALDRLYLVITGILWLSGWMYLEWFYSRAVQQGRLWAAVLRVTGIELVLLFALTILPMFFTTAGVNWPGAALSTLALLAGLGLLWLAKRRMAAQTGAGGRMVINE